MRCNSECGHDWRRSKLAASVLAGVDNIHIKPGCKVLYLGAASGTSVSHVSDIVGPTGAVYAVEFSHRSGESRLPGISACQLSYSLIYMLKRPSQLHLRRADWVRNITLSLLCRT